MCNVSPVPPNSPQAATQTGGTTSAEGQVERLLGAARVILENCGVEIGHSRLCRMVRRYVRDVAPYGWTFFDFLANEIALDADARRRALDNPAIARVIAYADPTGETAVNNVLRAHA